MKTFIRLFMALLLSLGLVTTSCSKDYNIDKNVNKINKMEEKYVKACAEKDFDKARAIIDEMTPLINETKAKMAANVAVGRKGMAPITLQKKYEALLKPLEYHLRYVNEKEIYDLLAKPSRDNDARIIYLFNTFDKHELPDMVDVLEVAISMGDENLSERLIKSGVETSVKIAKAAVTSSMQQIADLIITKQPTYLFDQDFGNAYKEEFGIDPYLSKLQTSLHNGIDLPSRPSFGLIHESPYAYQSAAEKFNKRCILLIREAVNAGRYDIAKKTLSLMVTNIDVYRLPDTETRTAPSTVWSTSNYKVTENKSLINEAQKIIQVGNR